MSGGGEKQKSTTTQTTAPWSGVQPYLTSGYQDLSSIYGQGAPNYYPQQTIAPFAPETEKSMAGISTQAQQGTDPLNTASSQYLQSVLGGQYLGQHGPGWDAVTNAARDSVNSMYGGAGRVGSGAHEGSMAGAIGQIAYQDYANQLARMDQAAALAPQVAGSTQAQNYLNWNQLGNVGTQRQAQGQDLINADIQKYNYEQNAPWDWAQQYLATLQGQSGGSQVTTQPYYSPSPWTQALGGGLALGGSMLGGYFGS